MLIAAFKLVDIAARSIFLLIVLFSLVERESGQFGLALTLIGLFGFLSGFERYLDLQRKLTGKSPRETDRLILATVFFFMLNYLLWLAPLAICLQLWVKLDFHATALWLLIAICEHLANEAYRVALVSTRHRPMLFIGTMKNLALMGVVASSALTSGSKLELHGVLFLWAVLSILSAIGSGVAFKLLAPSAAAPMKGIAPPSLRSQFRDSWTHFMIGLVALASLQIDRLLAGTLVSFEESGVYFRHLFLAAAAYQAFGVLSHNRILPKIYEHAVSGDTNSAQRLIARERRRYVPMSLAVAGSALLIGAFDLSAFAISGSVIPSYLAALILAYLVRGLADYNAILLNATYREKEIFKSQLYAVLATLGCGIALAPLIGLAGLIAAMFTGASVYLCLTQMRVSRVVPTR